MTTSIVTVNGVQVMDSGIRLRRDDREKRIAYMRRIVENGIKLRLPGLATPDVAYKHYPEDLDRLIEEIREITKNAHELKIARAHLAKIVANHNSRFGTRLRIPPPLSRLYPDTPLRTQQWSDARRRLNAAHEQWLLGLDTPQLLKLPASVRLGTLLYVAATYGALCVPGAIESLAKAVCNPKPIQMCATTGLQWIDLYYRHGKFTNATEGDEEVVYQPWPLTPMCKLAALGFLKANSGRWLEPPADSGASFNLIADSFQAVAATALPFRSLSKFLHVAFCVAERQPGSTMSEMHAEYSIGRVTSLSPDPAVWRPNLASAKDPRSSKAIIE